MCEPTTAMIAIGALVAAAGTGAQMYGTNQSNKAAGAAQLASVREQGQLQQRQREILNEQQPNKDKAKQAWQSAVQAETSPGQAIADQNKAVGERTPLYTAAAQQGAMGANPMQGASTVQTVNTDGTASTGAVAPLAISNAFAGQANRAQTFTASQAKARAFIDALNRAQQISESRIGGVNNKIGMYQDFVSGGNRAAGLYDSLKDMAAEKFQINSSIAAHKGDAWIAGGKLAQTVGQAAYAAGTSGGGGGGAAAAGDSSGAGEFASPEYL